MAVPNTRDDLKPATSQLWLFLSNILGAHNYKKITSKHGAGGGERLCPKVKWLLNTIPSNPEVKLYSFTVSHALARVECDSSMPNAGVLRSYQT